MTLTSDLIQPLHDAIRAFEGKVMDLTLDGAEGVSTAELGDLLKQLRNITKQLGYSDDSIVSVLSQRGELKKKGDMVPINGAVMERKVGSPRKKWDTPSLINVVVEKIIEEAIDPETGAIEVPPMMLLRRAFDYVGISYWKVKELEKIGVNADRYCEKEPGISRIVIWSGNPSTKSEEGTAEA